MNINIELVRNENVGFIGIGDSEYYVSPESFDLLAQKVATLVEQPGSVHIALELSNEAIPFEEVSESECEHTN